ncbi:MAG TPA: alpha/beta fold hydrolase [Chitinophagaceae bacterium]|nr:alpha/beta fold hydrolase [Chitinophagaceae bacterium]
MKRVFKILLWTLIVLFIVINFISATNAYKFTHFYDGGSKKEKPEDKKSAWDRLGDIFFGKDYFKKENVPVPDSFSAVTIASTDGIQLEGWYRQVANPNGSVALFHGYGDNKTKILPEAMGFLDMGYNVLLIDFRGHGNSSGNTCTIGYREADDVNAAYKFLKDKGEKNIILWGISMGAASIAHAVEEYHLQPSKVILEMPFATMKDAVEGQLNTMHLPEEPLGVLLTFWGGIEHGFWAFNVDPDEYVKNIHCPVLLQQGVSDIRVKPAETKEIYQNLHQPKHLIMYNSSGHESLCKKEHLKWLATVTAFLNS